MKKWPTLALLFVLLICAAEAGAQIAVSFRANATVTGPRIVLADIADIKAGGFDAEAIGQLPVAAAPAPGKSKKLSTVSVITSLRNRPEVADVDWQGSDAILVERQGNRIGQEQLQQIIDAYLKENSSKLPQTEIRFTPLRLPEELTLPAGKVSWKVTPSRPGVMGSTSFSIAFAVDGAPAGNCVVRGKLEAVAEVAVAAVTLHKGDVITESSVTMQPLNIGGLDNPFTGTEQLIGMQVARTVNVGTPLEQAHIVSPPIIKNGEMVKILARKGSMQLSASGLAKTEGRLGEFIPVKNISSNKVVHCRVDGPGMVSVEF